MVNSTAEIMAAKTTVTDPRRIPMLLSLVLRFVSSRDTTNQGEGRLTGKCRVSSDRADRYWLALAGTAGLSQREKRFDAIPAIVLRLIEAGVGFLQKLCGHAVA